MRVNTQARTTFSVEREKCAGGDIKRNRSYDVPSGQDNGSRE
jgi:hypothetical protein